MHTYTRENVRGWGVVDGLIPEKYYTLTSTLITEVPLGGAVGVYLRVYEGDTR